MFAVIISIRIYAQARDTTVSFLYTYPLPFPYDDAVLLP